MKYLQIVGTLLCVLLTIIALELRGLRPVTTGEWISAHKSNDIDRIGKMSDRMPIANVNSVHGRVDVGSTVDVRVENEVNVKGSVDVDNDVRVVTGGETLRGKYYEHPLKVEVVR